MRTGPQRQRAPGPEVLRVTIGGRRGRAAAASGRLRVAIADKNPMVRTGLADLVAGDPRFVVAGVAATGAELISLCTGAPILVCVIGWSLPDITGGEVIATLKRRRIESRIIVYTGETSPKVLRQAIKAGAWGFVSKGEEPEFLGDTIATVARGRLCLPYVDLQSLDEDPLETLTLRERELLGALAQGWSNEQIAARIGISKNTVKYHLKNLYEKVGVKNRAMAVAIFMSQSN